MKKGKVLVIDDDPLIRRLVPKILQKLDCDITSVATGEEALEKLGQNHFDFILLDLRLPGISGLEVLKETRLKSPASSVVVITAYGSIDSVRQALKLGATDYLEKPFEPEQLRALARRAFEQSSSADTGTDDDSREKLRTELVGSSRSIEEIRQMIERIARTRSEVTIIGEPGTGKELVARLIHQLSDRAGKPWLSVDCGQLPCDSLACRIFGQAKNASPDAQHDQPGVFEQAEKGTLFFKNVSHLNHELQTMLLRALKQAAVARIGSDQFIPVDVRVLAASSQRLEPLVENGRFDRNLYQRLNTVRLFLPALRERKEDLPALVRYFLAKLQDQGLAVADDVSPQFLEKLQYYDFPGNVRELQKIVNHCATAAPGKVLTPELIPREISTQAEAAELAARSRQENLTLKQAKALAVERMESRLIQQVLKESEGNFSLAARKLGISRSALYYKTKKYKISLPD